jgi:hypothetical protein
MPSVPAGAPEMLKHLPENHHCCTNFICNHCFTISYTAAVMWSEVTDTQQYVPTTISITTVTNNETLSPIVVQQCVLMGSRMPLRNRREWALHKFSAHSWVWKTAKNCFSLMHCNMWTWLTLSKIYMYTYHTQCGSKITKDVFGKYVCS